MVLLENDTFLNKLTELFLKAKTAGSGSVVLTMKKYDGRTKPKPRSGTGDSASVSEPQEYKCLIRATLAKRKISTVVTHKDVTKFQMAYSNLLKANMDNLKKKGKAKGNKPAANVQGRTNA